jgi:hypothetical protein
MKPGGTALFEAVQPTGIKKRQAIRYFRNIAGSALNAPSDGAFAC